MNQVKIDWTTGRVTITSEDSVIQAFLTEKGSDSQQEARSFLALLRDGFAVKHEGVNIEGPGLSCDPLASTVS